MAGVWCRLLAYLFYKVEPSFAKNQCLICMHCCPVFHRVDFIQISIVAGVKPCQSLRGFAPPQVCTALSVTTLLGAISDTPEHQVRVLSKICVPITVLSNSAFIQVFQQILAAHHTEPPRALWRGQISRLSTPAERQVQFPTKKVLQLFLYRCIWWAFPSQQLDIIFQVA